MLFLNTLLFSWSCIGVLSKECHDRWKHFAKVLKLCSPFNSFIFFTPKNWIQSFADLNNRLVSIWIQLCLNINYTQFSFRLGFKDNVGMLPTGSWLHFGISSHSVPTSGSYKLHCRRAKTLFAICHWIS